MMRSTCLSNIESYLREMRTLIVRSGVPAERYDEILNRAEKLDDEKLDLLSEFLATILVEYWRPAYEVWVLPAISHPEKADAVWEMYGLMGLRDNPEQIMLKDKLKILNTEIRKVIRTCLKRKRSASKQSRSN